MGSRTQRLLVSLLAVSLSTNGLGLDQLDNGKDSGLGQYTPRPAELAEHAQRPESVNDADRHAQRPESEYDTDRHMQRPEYVYDTDRHAQRPESGYVTDRDAQRPESGHDKNKHAQKPKSVFDTDIAGLLDIGLQNWLSDYWSSGQTLSGPKYSWPFRMFRGRSRDVCDRYDANGCSVPFGAPFFFKSLFTPSCNKHDICYSCGAQYGVDRKSCDQEFTRDMKAVCVSEYGKRSLFLPFLHRKTVLQTFHDLLNRFDQVILKAMTPVLDLSRPTTAEDVRRFGSHAANIHTDVVRTLMELLTQETRNTSPRRVIYPWDMGDLLGARGAGRSSVIPGGFDFAKDHGIAMKVCEDVLHYFNGKSFLADAIIQPTCQEVQLLSCYTFDFLYFLVVRIFGQRAFHAMPEGYCGEEFVKSCLPHPLPH